MTIQFAENRAEKNNFIVVKPQSAREFFDIPTLIRISVAVHYDVHRSVSGLQEGGSPKQNFDTLYLYWVQVTEEQNSRARGVKSAKEPFDDSGFRLTSKRIHTQDVWSDETASRENHLLDCSSLKAAVK